MSKSIDKINAEMQKYETKMKELKKLKRDEERREQAEKRRIEHEAKIEKALKLLECEAEIEHNKKMLDFAKRRNINSNNVSISVYDFILREMNNQ